MLSPDLPADDRIETGDGLSLADHELELVMLYVDGELTRDREQLAVAEQLAVVEQLLSANPIARSIADDLLATKAAVAEHIVGELAASQVQADLSMLRGRVMTKIPAAPRPVTVATTAVGWTWIAWARNLGFGKVSVAFGTAVALAAWIAIAMRPALPPLAAQANMAAIAEDAQIGDQQVIIEEMEIDGETISVKPGTDADRPTVIWHFADAQPGEG